MIRLLMQIMKLSMKKKKNKLIYIYCYLIALFIACNNDSAESSWIKAKNYYNNKQYNESAAELSSIINSDKHIDIIPDALFLLSEIYLNEYQEYYIAINYLDQIIDRFPEDELAKRSLFTKAYIYANYLDQFTDASILYESFLSKYPEDELVGSVKYELEELYKYSDIVKSIIDNK